ncbi:MAG: Rrf2 family transcriptional regulator [Acidimicrobiia bacterium]|nr:Rrf2 family transcriptional regulator [Acidimicrobiia bacterium]
MIQKTSISAIRGLVFLAKLDPVRLFSPRKLAEAIDESPTYMAKISRLLVKAGILRSHKGSKGGVEISRSPEQISLLEIVEACQGTIVGDYCSVVCDPDDTCAYHQAAAELRQAIIFVLSRWNLAQLVARPAPRLPLETSVTCVLQGSLPMSHLRH